MQDTQQKISLITGASSGLGRALAVELAARGETVIAVARREHELTQLVAQQPNIVAFCADVTNAQSMTQLVEQIQQQYPQLHRVILNAGTCEYADAQALDLSSVHRTFELNVFAIYRCTKLLLPLIARHGQIAIVSSLAYVFPFSRNEIYGASKAAVSYFADSLRLDLAACGIRICLIEPGFVATPLTAKNQFHMPFLIKADDAAKRMANALMNNSKRCQFPRRLVLVLRLLNLLPYALRQKVAALIATQ